MSEKLSQITSGGTVAPTTDQLVAVRSGAVDVLVQPGQAAAKAVSNNTYNTVASVPPSGITATHVATFADTAGTLQDGGVLGTAANQSASSITGTVAAVNGGTTVGHLAVFSDTAGTVQDGGAVPATGVTSFNTLTGAVTISAGANVSLTPSGSNIQISVSGSGVIPYLVGSGTATSADATDSIALGNGAAVNSGSTYMVVIGTGATTASGVHDSVAIGHSAQASGTEGVAVGSGAISGGSTAVGYLARANVTGAVAIGSGVLVSNGNSTVIGAGASDSNTGDIVIGAAGSAQITVNGATKAFTVPSDGNLLHTSASLSNGASTNAATITNGPLVGNPTKWAPINDNGTVRYIPMW
jgi:trimeric autotransporter adhesin